MDAAARSLLGQLIARLSAVGVTARFEPAEKLHITLAFLGWVDAAQLAEIKETLADVTAGHEMFGLRLDRISAFPSERRPRVIWVGAYKTDKRYKALSDDLRTRFGALGFAFKTDAVAHVTLCRLKHSDAPLAQISDFSPIGVSVREIALFQSLQAAHTTRYHILQRAPLQEPSSGSS